MTACLLTQMSHRSTRTGPAVWDHLWAYSGSPGTDDKVLARERRNPRWSFSLRAIETALGDCKGLRTVELGSGRGDLSALMAERGAEVTLLDYSDAALAQARRRFDRLGLEARFVRTDFLGDLDDLAGCFDVSMSLGVIEHFHGAARTRSIRAHRRLIRDGGIALIGVPNAACPPYRFWKMMLEIPQWWPYGLEIPYSRAELVRRARQADLTCIDVQCTGLWQSVGDHCIRGFLGRGPDWVLRRSYLDRLLGGNLTLIARAGCSATPDSANKLSPAGYQSELQE